MKMIRISNIEEDEMSENPIEHEDETVPVSVYEVGESSTAAIPREDGDRLLPGFMRRDIDSLFGRMVNFLRRLCGRETAYALVEKKSEAKDKLVEKLGNVKEKAECKKLKNEFEEAKLSNTFLHMQNERVERDLYWTRVRAHEFYQEMIHKGFVFEERPNEAIDVPIEDVKSSSPKESKVVDASYCSERERRSEGLEPLSGSRLVKGQDTANLLSVSGHLLGYEEQSYFLIVDLKELLNTRWFEIN
ncbi:hypothetical protein Tco_0988612 [Tanacetum coccineum]|uniref:Uncharacterized protein n=1 Tax=Tanacetum coccineum TaxID=301880 RepID=A0ABQ5ERW6_9ASTR